MPKYSEELERRIPEALPGVALVKKKMFGGLCFLHNGNMLCGVHKDFLILRLGPDQAQEALEDPRVGVFDITGKPMKGWVMVDEGGYAGEALEPWLARALAFAETLPAK